MKERIHTPTPTTLRKYGFTEKDWDELMERQGHCCGACGRVPGTLRLVIDHEHIRNWKKMKAEERKLYVRGGLCWT